MATEVAFHTQVPDKLGYTCRLLRKISRQGLRVAVVGEPEVLGRLDQALWVFEHEDFVPHLRLRPGEQPTPRTLRTPIWLLDDGDGPVDAAVLVNLGPEFPIQPERFARVVEIVSTHPDDAQAGRGRWRQYAAQSMAPVNHPFRGGADSAPGR